MILDEVINMMVSYQGEMEKKRKTNVSWTFFSILLNRTPNKFMADNGGEFCNAEYVDLCENFNIEIQTSAVEIPFSNGMIERHHAVLAQTVLKTKEDTNCSWALILAGGLNAKNSLQVFGSYSAYQLAIGRNPPFPNVIDNKLPALKEKPSCKIIAETLDAMHKAREAFIKYESNNNISKAIRSQVRTCHDNFFYNGEKVFLKRNKEAK